MDILGEILLIIAFAVVGYVLLHFVCYLIFFIREFKKNLTYTTGVRKLLNEGKIDVKEYNRRLREFLNSKD